MRFCEQCGAQLEPEARFCDSCGAKIEAAVAPAPQTPPEGVYGGAPSKPPKERKPLTQKQKIIAVCSAAAAVVLVSLIAIIVSFTGQIQVKDYIQVETNGYNGYGTIQTELDYDRLSALAKKGGANASKSSASSSFSSSSLKSLLNTAIEIDVSQTKNLKNGDSVAITVIENKEALKQLKKQYGLKLKCSDFTYTVSNLPEAEQINPFDYLKVTFTGVDGNGAYELETVGGTVGNLTITSCYDDEIKIYNKTTDKTYRYEFYAEGKSGNLTNGTQIKITVEQPEENLGFVFTQTENVYTAVLGTYLTVNDGVTPTMLDGLLNTYLESYNTDIRNWKRTKVYFMYPNSDAAYYKNQILIIASGASETGGGQCCFTFADVYQKDGTLYYEESGRSGFYTDEYAENFDNYVNNQINNENYTVTVA